MSAFIQQVVIVGGGTAGWLTAGIIAAEYRVNNVSGVKITLVESPDVGTIGVGEGTWPSMRATLKKIGISETELIKVCDASFKQGSKFVGWKNGLESDVYYHPFTLPSGYGEVNLFAAWKTHYSNMAFADAVTIQGQMCEMGCAPKQITAPEYAGALNYGYHLDAGKFAGLLQKHCTDVLGVKHVLDHVLDITPASNGDIESIKTRSSGDIQGDLFIDCTGLACLLIGQHYGIPFVDKKAISINDCALATQIPYNENANAIASPTIATAHSAGWTWDIGLSSRRGVGYVYSSAHISDENAERELRVHLAKSIGKEKADKISARKIAIRSGHREQFWHKNCVAIGMAAGFIEPLEASALALVELSASMIRDEMPMTRETMAVVAKRFNEVTQYRWRRIISFLKLHYILTQRRDTEYWCDVSKQDAIPEDLHELLLLWKLRPPNDNDFNLLEEIFPSASYQYVLYGMGFEGQLSRDAKVSDHLDRGIQYIQENVEKASKYGRVLSSNRDLIEKIQKYGLQKI